MRKVVGTYNANINFYKSILRTLKILKPMEPKKKTILNEVKSIFETQSTIDYEHYTKKMNKILAILENSFEKDLKEVKEAIDPLIFISENKLGGILAEKQNLARIIKIFSENRISNTIKVQLVKIILDYILKYLLLA